MVSWKLSLETILSITPMLSRLLWIPAISEDLQAFKQCFSLATLRLPNWYRMFGTSWHFLKKTELYWGSALVVWAPSMRISRKHSRSHHIRWVGLTSGRLFAPPKWSDICLVYLAFMIKWRLGSSLLKKNEAERDMSAATSSHLNSIDVPEEKHGKRGPWPMRHLDDGCTRWNQVPNLHLRRREIQLPAKHLGFCRWLQAVRMIRIRRHLGWV